MRAQPLSKCLHLEIKVLACEFGGKTNIQSIAKREDKDHPGKTVSRKNKKISGLDKYEYWNVGIITKEIKKYSQRLRTDIIYFIEYDRSIIMRMKIMSSINNYY